MGNAVSTNSTNVANKTKGQKRSSVRRGSRSSIIARAGRYVVPVELATKLVVDMHLTSEQIQEAKEAFAAYDKGGNGTIRTKSIIYVMRSLGQNPTEEETSDMICEADPNGSRIIEFVDFLEMWAKYISGDLDITIKEAFNLFDKDGSGTVSLEEFRYVMTSEGAQMTDEDIDEIIKNVDIDGDGQMNIDEFVSMLLRT